MHSRCFKEYFFSFPSGFRRLFFEVNNKRVLKVDESQYAGDDEMEYIVHRLQSAAADPEMRYQMNAEEYFIPPLQDRDTAIMEQAKLIEQNDADLLEQQKMLRHMVENLTKNGMDKATVMKMTGLTEEQLKDVL